MQSIASESMTDIKLLLKKNILARNIYRKYVFLDSVPILYIFAMLG